MSKCLWPLFFCSFLLSAMDDGPDADDYAYYAGQDGSYARWPQAFLTYDLAIKHVSVLNQELYNQSGPFETKDDILSDCKKNHLKSESDQIKLKLLLMKIIKLKKILHR